jgi:hypothetical protein
MPRESFVLPPPSAPARFATLDKSPQLIAKCADSGTSLSKYRQHGSDLHLYCFVVPVSCPRNTCMFRRRSVGCFSRRSEPDSRYRRAYLGLIRKDPPRRRQNSQLAAARRVAMKMGRRLRCSSVTYRFRIRALLVPVRLGPPCRRPILIATKHARISGTGH